MKQPTHFKWFSYDEYKTNLATGNWRSSESSLALDARDRRFKSCIPDKEAIKNKEWYELANVRKKSVIAFYSPVAQLAGSYTLLRWRSWVRVPPGEQNQYLDGVTEAYFFYMERVGVRFSLKVQTIHSRTDWSGGEIWETLTSSYF